MPSAKEMFKDISYELTREDKDVLIYTHSIFRGDYIVFCKYGEQYFISEDITTFTPKLHLAIHQQLKERGWI